MSIYPANEQMYFAINNCKILILSLRSKLIFVGLVYFAFGHFGAFGLENPKKKTIGNGYFQTFEAIFLGFYSALCMSSSRYLLKCFCLILLLLLSKMMVSCYTCKRGVTTNFAGHFSKSQSSLWEKANLLGKNIDNFSIKMSHLI